MKLKAECKSVLAFIRCFISTPSPSSVPLRSVSPVLRPYFTSPSVIASMTSSITPVFLGQFLLPVGVSPLPISVLLPLLLPVPFSFPLANLQ